MASRISSSLLQVLQSRTKVDCDTMDSKVAKEAYGPFFDCTSNQAIAFFELQKPERQLVIQKAINLSEKFISVFPGLTSSELAVEIAMVLLQLEISSLVTGFVHIQTNPYHSYNTEKTVANANRIVSLFEKLDLAFDARRVCIKIPGTWEGFQACRVLQSDGVATLGTTIFNMEQAALAGEVGCHYIAPYVNELKVHFEDGFVDKNKAQRLCVEAQRYYEQHELSTQVLPASLVSIDDIMALAGVHHITIAPSLLLELSNTPASSQNIESLFDKVPGTTEPIERHCFGENETAYRTAFASNKSSEGARKLDEAIKIFRDFQTKLEAMMNQG